MGDLIQFDLTAKGATMSNEKDVAGEKSEEKAEKKEKKEITVINEEMIRWMKE